MGRRATRQLTWQFILRTFKRVGMIAARHSAKAIAKAMVERGVEIPSPQYMDEVWQYMCKIKEEAGGDIHAHPNGNCPQCGRDIGRDHNGARYCSTRCRQRAYRIRKAAADKVARERQHHLYRHFGHNGGLLYVGITKNPGVRKSAHKQSPWAAEIAEIKVENYPTREAAEEAEALAILTEKPFHNRSVFIRRSVTFQMARGSIETSPLEDTSPNAESETNVTPAEREAEEATP
jgi:hypothetical protein